MPSKYLHEVIVGNIGTVYSGHSTTEAQEKFHTYKEDSKRGVGRAAEEDVTWLRNGDIYREYYKPQKKLKVHNEYFAPVSLKRCPTCHDRVPLGEFVWGWYEYLRVQKRLVMHFCERCFPSAVQPRLMSHAEECGCTFSLNVQARSGEKSPDWLTLSGGE